MKKTNNNVVSLFAKDQNNDLLDDLYEYSSLLREQTYYAPMVAVMTNDYIEAVNDFLEDSTPEKQQDIIQQADCLKHWVSNFGVQALRLLELSDKVQHPDTVNTVTDELIKNREVEK